MAHERLEHHHLSCMANKRHGMGHGKHSCCSFILANIKVLSHSQYSSLSVVVLDKVAALRERMEWAWHRHRARGKVW